MASFVRARLRRLSFRRSGASYAITKGTATQSYQTPTTNGITERNYRLIVAKR